MLKLLPTLSVRVHSLQVTVKCEILTSWKTYVLETYHFLPVAMDKDPPAPAPPITTATEAVATAPPTWDAAPAPPRQCSTSMHYSSVSVFQIVMMLKEVM